jgi:putative flippase GtrA
MSNFVVQDDLHEFTASTGQSLLSPTRPESSANAELLTLAQPVPSYQPYTWNFLNQALDVIDDKTHGKAGWLQRFVSYIFFGGLAALVNLGIFYVMYYRLLVPVSPLVLRNAISYVIAAECSIIANFIPNDRFTFRSLPGAERPWMLRFLRFHATAIVGTMLTFLIEMGLSSLAHTEPIIAEAVATMLVLIYNFTFHHIFTYRHVKQA